MARRRQSLDTVDLEFKKMDLNNDGVVSLEEYRVHRGRSPVKPNKSQQPSIASAVSMPQRPERRPLRGARAAKPQRSSPMDVHGSQSQLKHKITSDKLTSRKSSRSPPRPTPRAASLADSKAAVTAAKSELKKFDTRRSPPQRAREGWDEPKAKYPQPNAERTRQVLKEKKRRAASVSPSRAYRDPRAPSLTVPDAMSRRGRSPARAPLDGPCPEREAWSSIARRDPPPLGVRQLRRRARSLSPPASRGTRQAARQAEEAAILWSDPLRREPWPLIAKRDPPPLLPRQMREQVREERAKAVEEKKRVNPFFAMEVRPRAQWERESWIEIARRDPPPLESLRNRPKHPNAQAEPEQSEQQQEREQRLEAAKARFPKPNVFKAAVIPSSTPKHLRREPWSSIAMRDPPPSIRHRLGH